MKEVKSYSYCVVDRVEKKSDSHGAQWIAHCVDGETVIFGSVINEGNCIYFTPYFEGEDPAMHGYIKNIEDLL